MRRSIVAKGLVLAMEGDEEIAGSSASEFEEAMGEVSGEVEEINESESEIDDIETATDSAIDDADTLEDIADVMEESVEKGEGLDETSAEIAEIAIESICARLGIKVQDRLLPATESFGSDNSRVAATRIALETVKETLKRAWEAIKNALKMVRDKIVELYKKYFTAFGSIKRGYQKLSEEVSKFKGGKLADDKKEITNKYVARLFSGPKADDKKVVEFSDGELIVKNHIGITKAINVSGIVLSNVLQKMNSGVANYSPYEIEKASNSFLNSWTAWGDAELAGGQTLSVKTEPDWEGWKARLIFEFTEASKAEKIKTLSSDEINNLLKLTKDLLDQTDTYIGSSNKYQEQIKHLSAIADSVIKLADTEIVEDQKESMKQVKKDFKRISDTINNTRKTIPGINIKCIKGSFAYIKTSMDQY